MMKKPERKNHTRNKGSILAVTIVITTVLFSIGITFASILEKEITRQFYSRDSQVALNIANSALECALFNDFRRYAFDSVSDGDERRFSCGDIYQVRAIDDWDEPYILEDELKDDPGKETKYAFEIIDMSNIELGRDNLGSKKNIPCARVTVERRCPAADVTCPQLIKSIEVKGYHRCAEDNENERELVRRFRLFY